MENQNSGWDKINQQEEKSVKKTKLKENLDTAAETTSNIAWIVFVIAAAIIGISALAIYYLVNGG